MKMADEGVGRGPGGPPHKLSDIAQECVRHNSEVTQARRPVLLPGVDLVNRKLGILPVAGCAALAEGAGVRQRV